MLVPPSSSNDLAHCSSVLVLSLINVISDSLFPMSPVFSAMSSTVSVCDSPNVCVRKIACERYV